MKDKIALPTIWQIPDDLWELLSSILPPVPTGPRPGRPRLDPRRVFDGILYVLRTGCQWKHVPREFGSGSSIHRYFQYYRALDVFELCWGLLLERYDDLIGIDWQWQAADGAIIKAPLGGSETGPNPTDRGKSGSKRHLLVDRRGAPLSMEIAGANRPDMRLLESTLAAIVVQRPEPGTETQ